MTTALRRGNRASARDGRFRRPAGAEARRPGMRPEVSLEDKYLLEDGRILLTGVQGLVRLPLDQHRADRARGLTTATMISGYQGSPLGGLDQELSRNRELAEAHHVKHVPGLNEELGATSAWGSQLASALPGARYDGVIGMWYGKAPGLDRAADSLRHGNFVGVSRTGGGLAVVGDDPSCKSSTIPSASEPMLASMHMPVFFPGSVQEVLDLGLHAVACSRASGLWVGFKIVTSVADAVSTANVAPGRVDPSLPVVEWNGSPYEHVPSGHLLAPVSLEMERTLLGPRTELALAYARENGVNRIEGVRDAWLGVVAPGKAYYDLMHALRSLGLEGPALERAGIRVLKLGMVSPLEPEIAREFARGLDEIVVAEEKGPFVETLLKEILYGMPAAPRVLGKRDDRGELLLPAELDLDADLIARAIAARLAAREIGIDSVSGADPQARRDRGSRAPDPADRGAADGDRAHALLLLGLPAQLVGQGARGHARRRRHRLPHDGPAEPGGQGRDHRHHADGRRGRAVDRHGAVHGRPPPRPEPRRRHLPPLGLARRARRRRRGSQHHLQAALQRARGHDGWPGDRGAAERSRPHPLARARGRAPHHRHDRGHEALPGRRAREHRRGARPQGAARLPAGALRDRRRDRADPRPGVRRRAAPQAQARQGRRAGGARLDQRARLRGLRRLRQEVELPVGRAGRHGVRAQDRDPPGLLQQGPVLPRGRLPVLRHGDPGRQGEARHSRADRRAARAALASSRPTTSASA